MVRRVVEGSYAQVAVGESSCEGEAPIGIDAADVMAAVGCPESRPWVGVMAA